MSAPTPKQARKSRRRGDQLEKRLELVTHIQALQGKQERIEAIQLARAIAIAGLPRRRTAAKSISRNFRLGSALWLRVTYTQVHKTVDLPFGEDRFALAAIQHLAIDQKSPVVFFDRVGHLLDMFGLPEDGRELSLLRNRLQRLSGLVISLVFANSEAGLDDPQAGENIFIIKRYVLPTRHELRMERHGQLRIPQLSTDPELNRSPYGIVINRDFYDHLQDTKNLLTVPIDLMRLFINRPLAWDYLMFLLARCNRAYSASVIDHETLMELFRDGTEPDRKCIERLLSYHSEIMSATGGKLNASLEQMGYLERKGARGPKPKRWVLRVGPSESILGQSSDQPIRIQGTVQD